MSENDMRASSAASVLPYTTAFAQCPILHKPDCALCHVSLQKMMIQASVFSELVPLFSSMHYSTTPTTMTQNASVMLNCFSTVLNSEFSVCSTQCATMSDCTLRPEPGCRWSDTVSCVLTSRHREDTLLFATVYTHDFSSPGTHVTEMNCYERNELANKVIQTVMQ